MRLTSTLITLLFVLVGTIGCTAIEETSTGTGLPPASTITAAPTSTVLDTVTDTPAAPASAANQSSLLSDEENPPSLSSEVSESPTADADVLFVTAKQVENESWYFSVTVAHPDTGWDDYADGWDVVLPDGTVVKPDPDSRFTRLLLHPHENEQPFTRSQGGIMIPSTIQTVTLRAHDLLQGFGGREIVVDLSVKSAPDYEVHRLGTTIGE